MKIALGRVSTYQSWHREACLALGYIAAVLEREGLEVRIFDGRYFEMDDRMISEEIKKFSPDLIGFTSMTHEIKRVVSICSELKGALHVPVVVGGCHITALPVETMEEFPTIDYGIIGEGEDTILDLIRFLDGRLQIESVDGIVYRDGARVVQTGPRSYIKDLERVPFPAFHHYFKEGDKSLRAKGCYYQMLASRGCPFRCAFCMRALGGQVRRRSPRSIVEEIDFAVRSYGAHTIDFADELFLSRDARTRDTLLEFIKAGIPDKVRWSGSTRANLVDEEIIELAKKSGAYRLELGVESGNEEILARIHKGITVDEVRNAVSIMKKQHIRVDADYILGHPGENDVTARQTIDLAASLGTDTIAVGIMVPYPGTEVYEWARKGEYGYRLKSTDWSDYDKYGAPVLELEGMPIAKLESLQRKAYLMFYLRNKRILGLLRFVISKYRGIAFVLWRQLSRKGHG
jgi:anaerobic magnesium-protoporphyrin IX monomethyl ester cyclase